MLSTKTTHIEAFAAALEKTSPNNPMLEKLRRKFVEIKKKEKEEEPKIKLGSDQR